MNKFMQDFIEKFEKKVKETIEKYKLATKEDKILVACSGGKDSTTVLYLLKKFGYNVEALHINLLMGSWSKENERNIRKFCKEHGIKLYVFSIRDELGYSICYIKSVVQQKAKLKQCTICGIIRRWLINKKARALKASKVATGHNLDDEAQTVIMNLIKGNPWLGINQGPVTGTIEEKKFVTRIKPLFFCKEKDIRKYSELMKFPVLYRRCPCVVGALRHEVRKKLDELEKKNKNIKENIVSNWLEIKKLLIQKQEQKPILYCKNCGEPSRREICKACSILKKIS
ncbi:MAG: TIGR00269 family protein [Candidatus Pacearchaeota archaeon]